eukprot:4615312-Amphidinium_carterae.1
MERLARDKRSFMRHLASTTAVMQQNGSMVLREDDVPLALMEDSKRAAEELGVFWVTPLRRVWRLPRRFLERKD